MKIKVEMEIDIPDDQSDYINGWIYDNLIDFAVLTHRVYGQKYHYTELGKEHYKIADIIAEANWRANIL